MQQPSTQKLTKYRDMGSMEGLFTILNDLKIPWGAAAGILKIPGLHKISNKKLQSIWNQIHAKYHSLQVQFLTYNDKIYQYDPIYIGCLPFKIIRNNDSNVYEILRKEINHRYLLLNDFGLTAEDIKNGNYDINAIPPLYRVIFCNDYYLFSYQHATGDGGTATCIHRDFLCLINNDIFDNEIKFYTKLEDCIDTKYVISSLSLKLSQYIPMNFAFNFLKFYTNNSLLCKYNPLNIHRDDILTAKYIFDDNMLRFPVSSYNKFDFDIDVAIAKIPKSVTLIIKQKCKLKKVHISSVLQYIANAALIETHSNIFDKEYYKTVIGNAFSTKPLYTDSNKLRYGCHASNYWTIIEYYKNIQIGSNKFWNEISSISAQVLNDDLIRKLYKNKFPFWNMKKIKQWAWNQDNAIAGKVPFGPPTVTNPGVMSLHKKNYKYKVTEFFGGVNPMVGAGATYILAALSIKNIDDMNLSLCYGTQFFTKHQAQEMVDTIKEKLEMIASSNTNYTAKL